MDKVEQLVSGRIEPEHLAMLIKVARIISKRVITALELHFVEGIPATQAGEQAGCVNRQEVYRGINSVNQAHEFASQLARFY